METKEIAVIVDIDGTLMNVNHRRKEDMWRKLALTVLHCDTGDF